MYTCIHTYMYMYMLVLSGGSLITTSSPIHNYVYMYTCTYMYMLEAGYIVLFYCPGEAGVFVHG